MSLALWVAHARPSSVRNTSGENAGVGGIPFSRIWPRILQVSCIALSFELVSFTSAGVHNSLLFTFQDCYFGGPEFSCSAESLPVFLIIGFRLNCFCRGGGPHRRAIGPLNCSRVMMHLVYKPAVILLASGGFEKTRGTILHWTRGYYFDSCATPWCCIDSPQICPAL